MATSDSIAYLIKVPAFIVIMLAEAIAFHPPNNPPPKTEDRAKYGRADLITRISSWFPKFGLFLNYTVHLAEIAAILARVYPAYPLSQQVLSHLFADPARSDRLAISTPFIFGFLLLAVGAMLRKVCYDTLGKFFTYQLALFKGHKLVTWGPYAIVRHPSYSAFILAVSGLLVVELGPGTYLHESGLLENRWVAGCGMLWTLWCISIVVVSVRRASKEDEVLREEFGKEWEEWAKRTPYRLVPYLY